MKRVIFALAALALSAACSHDTTSEVLPTPEQQHSTIIPDDANAGEIIIKFAKEMEPILDQTMTRSAGEVTRSGIPSTDEVLDILGAYHFERIFPVDVRHEERTREAGLHLWYLVRFDESENLATAVERLSALGEVDKLQCNRPIHRAYNAEATPHFISCAEVDAMAATRSHAMPFNDPEMCRQWCYINHGDYSFTQPWAGVVAGCDAVVLQCVQYSFSGHGDNIVTCAEDGSANTAHHSTNGSHCGIILSNCKIGIKHFLTVHYTKPQFISKEGF